MSVFKGLIMGLLGGLGFAITSYWLITPYMRHNLFAIGAFGVRGLLFSAFFLFFMSLIARRNKHPLHSHPITRYAIIGSISGLLCPLLDIVITYHSFLASRSGIPSPMVHASLLIDLGLIAVGYSVIGTIVGLIIAYSQRAKHKK